MRACFLLAAHQQSTIDTTVHLSAKHVCIAARYKEASSHTHRDRQTDTHTHRETSQPTHPLASALFPRSIFFQGMVNNVDNWIEFGLGSVTVLLQGGFPHRTNTERFSIFGIEEPQPKITGRKA